MTWLQVTGKEDPELALNIQKQAEALNLDPKHIQDIKELSFRLVDSDLDLDSEMLNKLRMACQLWDVDLRMNNITSHRKFIGPVIVFIKKLFAPFIKFFLKDFIRQQKDFNAAVIGLIGGVMEKREY